jgi:hypothetical protein
MKDFMRIAFSSQPAVFIFGDAVAKGALKFWASWINNQAEPEIGGQYAAVHEERLPHP